MPTIRLPHNWKPRAYQLPLWRYLENGGKRALAVWHRRAGKDDLCLNFTACQAMQKVGNYWHMLPEAAQARKAIWKAVNPHTGKKRIDEAFPLEIRKSTNDTEMFIEFINGSSWQVLGSDNYNSQVGSTPRGIVFSEWALADPNAWAYMRPILAENGGWALFITTPRGRNHAKSMYDAATKAMGEDGSWFCQKLTAEQTGVFTKETLESELRELIAEMGEEEGTAKYLQEYFCSFDAALPGAYYGKEMNAAEQEERIRILPYDRRYPVYPVFDLGFGDSTAILFCQVIAGELRVIDYHESSGQSVPFYAKLMRDKPYVLGKLILPHDAGTGSVRTGNTIEQQFNDLGFETEVLPVVSRDAGIKTARTTLAITCFHSTNCERLIECLRHYHREWDDKNKVFRPTPKHDWSSHGSDAYRYAAEAFNAGLMDPENTSNKDEKPSDAPIGPQGWMA
ncbi:hypothetical protein [Methylobacterium sp. 1030]|uniref:hypothetical protein n=1 Tax=Methylobacterium sp. 1030 TaxID=3156404 RepID=UPI003393BE2D